MTHPERVCPGCGRYHYLGVCCVGCWPRIPWEIRRDIVWGTTRTQQAARQAARKWLKGHPQR